MTGSPCVRATSQPPRRIIAIPRALGTRGSWCAPCSGPPGGAGSFDPLPASHDQTTPHRARLLRPTPGGLSPHRAPALRWTWVGPLPRRRGDAPELRRAPLAHRLAPGMCPRHFASMVWRGVRGRRGDRAESDARHLLRHATLEAEGQQCASGGESAVHHHAQVRPVGDPHLGGRARGEAPAVRARLQARGGCHHDHRPRSPECMGRAHRHVAQPASHEFGQRVDEQRRCHQDARLRRMGHHFARAGLGERSVPQPWCGSHRWLGAAQVPQPRGAPERSPAADLLRRQ